RGHGRRARGGAAAVLAAARPARGASEREPAARAVPDAGGSITMSRLRQLRREDGQGLVSALLLLAGVLLPLMFLVPAFARIEQGRLAAAQAARDAVRAAVQAPSAGQAQQAASDALARARAPTGVPLELRLGGSFARGG